MNYLYLVHSSGWISRWGSALSLKLAAVLSNPTSDRWVWLPWLLHLCLHWHRKSLENGHKHTLPLSFTYQIMTVRWYMMDMFDVSPTAKKGHPDNVSEFLDDALETVDEPRCSLRGCCQTACTKSSYAAATMSRSKRFCFFLQLLVALLCAHASNETLFFLPKRSCSSVLTCCLTSLQL